MNTPSPRRKPADIPTLTPYLVCAGAMDAIAFYQRAFGATEVMRLARPDGKLMHATLRVGDSALMLSDEWPEAGSIGPATLKGTPVTLHVYVDDVDTAVATAVAAGATLVMPAQDMFWGDRYAQVQDPYGHRWALAHQVREMSQAEIQAAIAAMGPNLGGCGPDATS